MGQNQIYYNIYHLIKYFKYSARNNHQVHFHDFIIIVDFNVGT